MPGIPDAMTLRKYLPEKRNSPPHLVLPLLLPLIRLLWILPRLRFVAQRQVVLRPSE